LTSIADDSQELARDVVKSQSSQVHGTGGLPCLKHRRHARRKGPRSRQEIEEERRELLEKTIREIDEIIHDFHSQLPRGRAKLVGAVYARYSTRFQDSVADQVRGILEEAVKLGIFIPREMIFFDLAVRGYKSNRDGLNALRKVLQAKKVQVILLFSTSRLFRKQYRTLEFVDQVRKGWGIRCIFVKSGVDTDDKQRWETILATQSTIDQFVVSMYVENVRTAQQGLMEKRLVFGTISYGYRGDPIEGAFTKRGRPRCRLTIDPETAPIVLRIYNWYAEEGLSIDAIVRRLNDDPNIPLPPRCCNQEWTRTAVKGILANTRYRGLWRYGVTEAVYVPEGDYVRSVMRATPLREIQIEELRIVSDELWFKVQRRMAEGTRNRGRKPKHGDRTSRPKLLNGLFWCPNHDQPLYVTGSYGRTMACPRCIRMTAGNRPLYSSLNRELALKLTCEKLAELFQRDEALVQMVIKACQQEAESSQQADPARLSQLRARADSLTRSIQFNMRHGGDNEEDEAEVAQALADLRRERAGVMAEIGTLEAARQRPVQVPSQQMVRSLLVDLGKILTAAATSEERNAVLARSTIEALTGGRIDLFQQGERRAKRGWLQGRFRVRLIDYFVERAAGVPPRGAADSVEVIVDYRYPVAYEAEAERAKELYDLGFLGKQIAQELGCCRAKVTNLLAYAFQEHGQVKPDGRKRRGGLQQKQLTPARYQEIADQGKSHWDSGLSAREISRRLGCSDATVWKAIAHWHRTRRMAVPTDKSRRERIMIRAMELYDEGREIQEIASALGYSRHGITLMLQRWFTTNGQVMPDGRSRRHQCRRAG